MNSEQYAEEIKHTRADIDETLHTLEDRLSARELWEQAIRWSEGARDFSANLGRMVRENPIPSALMGISLLWFMASGASRQAERADISGIKSKMRGKYAEARGKYAEAKSTVSETTAEAGERARAFTEDLRHRGEHLREDLRHRGEHLREQGQEWKQKLQAGGADLSARPVLLSALGLAVGALVAMSLPVSRKEEEIIGERGREMYRKTSEVVGEQVERGKEAAAAATEAAREKYMGEEPYTEGGKDWTGATEKRPDDFRETPH